jgi:hypothetical protein
MLVTCFHCLLYSQTSIKSSVLLVPLYWQARWQEESNTLGEKTTTWFGKKYCQTIPFILLMATLPFTKCTLSVTFSTVSCLAVLGGTVLVEDWMALLHPSRLEGCHVELPALLALDLFRLRGKGLIRVAALLAFDLFRLQGKGLIGVHLRPEDYLK